MPELPEVETIARALGPALLHRSIERVEVFSPKLRTSLEPLKRAPLAGRVFTAVRRRGRYLLLVLDDGNALNVHLGMSGVIRIEPPEVPKRKHEHIFLHLSDGMVFRFECPRRFSLFEYVHLASDGSCPSLAKLGIEPLTDEFDGEFLYRAGRGSRAPVKTFLMDNAVVVGVGNIYCTEALFDAGIRPTRRAGNLTKVECARLAASVKTLLRNAILCGGSSIHDYRHIDGSEGNFQLTLAAYGRKNEPCQRCGTPLKAIAQGGRTTVFCPKCQK